MGLTQIRTKFERKKGQQKQIRSSIKDLKQEVKETEQKQIDLQEAQLIIQHVAQQTQEQLQYSVSELVSLAMEGIFDRGAYGVEVDFVLRSGKTEADIWFVKGEEKMNPMEATGGGAVDVGAFGFRPTLWSLERPRRRNSIFLDEPFRFLSLDLHPRASEMLKQVSEKLKLQIIMITHSPDLAEVADKVFHVGQKKGRSYIKEE